MDLLLIVLRRDGTGHSCARDVSLTKSLGAGISARGNRGLVVGHDREVIGSDKIASRKDLELGEKGRRKEKGEQSYQVQGGM